MFLTSEAFRKCLMIQQHWHVDQKLCSLAGWDAGGGWGAVGALLADWLALLPVRKQWVGFLLGNPQKLLSVSFVSWLSIPEGNAPTSCVGHTHLTAMFWIQGRRVVRSYPQYSHFHLVPVFQTWGLFPKDIPTLVTTRLLKLLPALTSSSVQGKGTVIPRLLRVRGTRETDTQTAHGSVFSSTSHPDHRR